MGATPQNVHFLRLCKAQHNRKNYLFCGSDAGGDRAAILYSLIASCQRNSIDPLAYLTDLLQRALVYFPRKINDLIPACWKRLFADLVRA
jgi:hypothetical protein